MDSNTSKPFSSQDITSIQNALESKSSTPIISHNLATTSYYDIQRLIYLQKQSPSKVQVIFNYRSNPEIVSLHQKLKSTGVTVASISIHLTQQSTENSDSATNLIVDHLDLLLYLSSQDVNDVQGFRGTANKDSTLSNFAMIAGTLVSGGSYSLHIAHHNKEKHITNIQVTLSTGEVLNTSLVVQYSSESTPSSANTYATLEECAKALRLYNCAVQSLKTSKIIAIKHIGDNVVPIRTVGTARFLGEGLFTPVSTSTKVAITGLHSGQTEKVKDIFQKRIQEGEPFEFFGTHDEVLKNPLTSKSWRQIVYIPSLPGPRKDKEMLDALKSGCIVLAEKPPFANADLAKEFLTKLDKDCERRLFFGWHYPHHFVIRKLLQDIRNNRFGNIKHIRTLFTVAIPYNKGANIWDLSEGGAGLNVHAYNLHCVLTLIGFDQSYEVVQSKIENASRLDPDNADLAKVDLVMDTKLKFGNGVTADLYTSLDLKEILLSEAEILFDNGTRVLCKQYCHPQLVINEGFEPILVQKGGSTVWENYLSAEEKANPEYLKTTYEKQVEFVRQQATGEGKYDAADNDIYGVGIRTGIKLHEIVDKMFTEAGYAKKLGA